MGTLFSKLPKPLFQVPETERRTIIVAPDNTLNQIAEYYNTTLEALKVDSGQNSSVSGDQKFGKFGKIQITTAKPASIADELKTDVGFRFQGITTTPFLEDGALKIRDDTNAVDLNNTSYAAVLYNELVDKIDATQNVLKVELQLFCVNLAKMADFVDAEEQESLPAVLFDKSVTPTDTQIKISANIISELMKDASGSTEQAKFANMLLNQKAQREKDPQYLTQGRARLALTDRQYEAITMMNYSDALANIENGTASKENQRFHAAYSSLINPVEHNTENPYNLPKVKTVEKPATKTVIEKVYADAEGRQYNSLDELKKAQAKKQPAPAEQPATKVVYVDSEGNEITDKTRIAAIEAKRKAKTKPTNEEQQGIARKDDPAPKPRWDGYELGQYDAPPSRPVSRPARRVVVVRRQPGDGGGQSQPVSRRTSATETPPRRNWRDVLYDVQLVARTYNEVTYALDDVRDRFGGRGNRWRSSGYSSSYDNYYDRWN